MEIFNFLWLIWDNYLPDFYFTSPFFHDWEKNLRVNSWNIMQPNRGAFSITQRSVWPVFFPVDLLLL